MLLGDEDSDLDLSLVVGGGAQTSEIFDIVASHLTQVIDAEVLKKLPNIRYPLLKMKIGEHEVDFTINKDVDNDKLLRAYLCMLPTSRMGDQSGKVPRFIRVCLG